MTFAPGSLVRTRGREWLVLPESADELLILRPLGGADAEVAGVMPALETVESATFAPPDATRLGNHRSASLLRDALRLGFRATAGPFRSLGRIAVEPRPYQLVPLLMAMRLDPVRLIVADDVGIGKTVEAGLIARELLDQGTADRLAVLCPPHLAEQWQGELDEKFHLEAELVLASTAPRLERRLRVDESIFDRHPYVIVSTDFIKSERRRMDFLRACPELVIVDEAHTCADPGGGTLRHQRHELLRGLSADRTRHLVLVTATPHSGNEDAFEALVRLVDPTLISAPDADESGRRAQRQRLAQHLVQRRRADIRAFLDESTPFPDRLSADATYALSPAMRALLDDALAYARTSFRSVENEAQHRKRVRWWSALALLRAISSSPAAAAATIANRSRADEPADAASDEQGRRSVLDALDDASQEGEDVDPGARLEGETETEATTLTTLAAQAVALHGDADTKLTGLVKLLRELLAEQHHPIVFCRFVATAEYLARELRDRLRGTLVEAVTGSIPPAEREARVLALAREAADGDRRRVLIATDCLSEGINLQELFDAVVHYDLAWNPTRHEQREGRVDRYGQVRDAVRVVTYYGHDNPVDGLVLRVLLRKHQRIRSTLGVSVPVPANSDQVLEAIVEALLLTDASEQVVDEQLALFEVPAVRDLETRLEREWESLAERERRSRTVYAQHSIGLQDVARELAAARAAVGTRADVERFVTEAVRAHGGGAVALPDGGVELDLTAVPVAVRDAVGANGSLLRVRFAPPRRAREELLVRTHPIVAGLASHVLDSALDGLAESVARRAAVIRTRAVETRTALLLTRYRFHVDLRARTGPRRLVAEDCDLVAFTGSPATPVFLSEDEVGALLDAAPDGNVLEELAARSATWLLDGLDALADHLTDRAERRAAELAESHRRIRAEVRAGRADVAPVLPVDVLGAYVYLPA